MTESSEKTLTISDGLDLAADLMYETSKEHGFWDEEPNLAEKIALMHSELSEALEILRIPGGLSFMSQKIPKRTALEEEMADALIRIFDFCGYLKLNIGAALIDKTIYNEKRPHKHGKKF